MIYLFIAGSYTPWLSLCTLPPDGFAYHLNWAIWPLAFLGIVYQQLFHEKYKWLETTFYLVIGIVPGLLATLEMVNNYLQLYQLLPIHIHNFVISGLNLYHN